MKFFFQTFLYLNVGIGALFFGIWFWTAFPFSTSAQAEQPAVSADPIEQAVASKQKSVASTKKAVTSVNKIMGKMAKIHPGVTSPQNQAKPQGLTPAKPTTAKVSTPPAKPTTAKVSKPTPSPNQAKSPPAQTTSTPSPNQAKSPPAQTASTPSPAVGSEAVTDSNQSAQLNHNKSTSPPLAKPSVKKEGELPAETTNKAPQDLAQKKVKNRAPASDNLPVPPPPSTPTEGNPPSIPSDEDFNTKIESAKNIAKKKGARSAETATELMDVNQKVVKIYKMLSAFEYDPQDKRDPFVPFRPKGLETEEEVEVFQHATSEFELSEIKLIGMKWGKGPHFSKAMFRTPDNEIHYLQAKDRIGNAGAIIDRLKEDKVVVLEPRFAVEAPSQSANSGPKRVFVPKIIHISRFKNPVKPKEESVELSSAVVPHTQKKPAKTKKNKKNPITPSSGP